MVVLRGVVDRIKFGGVELSNVSTVDATVEKVVTTEELLSDTTVVVSSSFGVVSSV